MQGTRQFAAIVIAWVGLSSMASAQEESTILRGPYLQNLQSVLNVTAGVGICSAPLR